MAPLVRPLRLLLTLTSVLGFVVLGYGLARGPLPPGWILSGLGAHALVCTLGVLVPSWGAWTEVCSRGVPGRKRVALTFDDGPHPETTRRVLAELAAAGQRATFFVLGEKAERHAQVLREIAAAGHEIGVHGYTHDRLYALRSVGRLRDDMRKGARAIERAIGRRPALFRAPVGFVGHTVALAAECEGLVIVGHGRRTLDGLARADPRLVLERAKAGLVDGGVILLHDAAERDDHEPASLAVLGELLLTASERGLRAVTVSELFDLMPSRG